MNLRLLLSCFVYCVCLSVLNVHAASLPDFTDLIEKSSPAVVKVNTTSKRSSGFQIPEGQLPEIFRHLLEPREQPERNMRSMGSGFFISHDGYLITNNHVIEDADEIVVQLTDRRAYDAVVVGTDPRSDLALLKVEEEGLPWLKIAEPDRLKVGEWVLAIGSPFDLEFSASVGIVSAIGRSIVNSSGEDYVPFIQTDVAINPGNSGGPLFNLNGEVVGVNSQIYTRSGGSIGVSFAIPAGVVTNVVNQLKEKGRVDRGWLGVVIQDVDKDLAKALGLKKPAGALIQDVVRDGPAEKAGLEAGDVITSFDGKRINSSGDLPHIVGSTEPGHEVSVALIREKKHKKLQVKVGTLSSGDVASASQVASSPIQGNSRLGVEAEELDEASRARLGIDGGVRVLKVDSSGPAAEAGVRSGDVIAQLGFEKIKGLKHFQQVVKDLPADTLLPIRFFSDGQAVFRTFIIKEQN